MAVKQPTEAEIRKSPEYRRAMTDTLLWQHKQAMAELYRRKLLDQVSGKSPR